MERLPVENSGPQEKLPVQKYEEEEGISRKEEDIFIEQDCQEGTCEEDDDEEGFTDLIDPESELFMEYERDRNNIPICKLVPATASDLEWEPFSSFLYF